MVPRFTFREAVAEALFHDGPYTVLGRRLDPFCLRHYLFLEAYGSPLIHGGNVTMIDLQTAALVCSTSSHEAFNQANGRANFFWNIWWIITGALSVSIGLNRFNRYLEDYFPEFPMYAPPGSASDDEGIPSLTIAAARCLPAFGRKETLNMPLGEMLIWSMSIAEAHGHRFDNIQKAIDIEGLREIDAEEKSK